MAAGGVAREACDEVFDEVLVAYDFDERGACALEFGVRVALGSSARLTLAHVAPPGDEPVDEREALGFELLAATPAAERRQRLRLLAWTVAAGVQTEVAVASGPVSSTMLGLLHELRLGLVLAGAPSPARRCRHRLPLAYSLAVHACCPVVLVPPWSEARAPARSPTLTVGHGERRFRLGAARLCRRLDALLSRGSSPVLVVPESVRTVGRRGRLQSSGPADVCV